MHYIWKPLNRDHVMSVAVIWLLSQLTARHGDECLNIKHAWIHYMCTHTYTHKYTNTHTHIVINPSWPLCPILPAAHCTATTSVLLLGYIHTLGEAHPLSYTFCLCPYVVKVPLTVHTHTHAHTIKFVWPYMPFTESRENILSWCYILYIITLF